MRVFNEGEPTGAAVADVLAVAGEVDDRWFEVWVGRVYKFAVQYGICTGVWRGTKSRRGLSVRDGEFYLYNVGGDYIVKATHQRPVTPR